MSKFDLTTLLSPVNRPQGHAFDKTTVANLQETSAKRRQVTVGVLREITDTDEYGGQSGVWKHKGQYSVWIQEMQTGTESTPLIGSVTESVRVYLVGFPPDADVEVSDRLATPDWLSDWRPNQQVVAGTLAIPSQPEGGNGHIYQSVNDGITGANEPLFNTSSGSVTPDGPVYWKEAGEINYFEIKTSDEAKSTPAEKVYVCEVIS